MASLPSQPWPLTIQVTKREEKVLFQRGTKQRNRETSKQGNKETKKQKQTSKQTNRNKQKQKKTNKKKQTNRIKQMNNKFGHAKRQIRPTPSYPPSLNP